MATPPLSGESRQFPLQQRRTLTPVARQSEPAQPSRALELFHVSRPDPVQPAAGRFVSSTGAALQKLGDSHQQVTTLSKRSHRSPGLGSQTANNSPRLINAEQRGVGGLKPLLV